MISGIGQSGKSLQLGSNGQQFVKDASQSKDQFLQMLLTQLRYQDPTAPQDADKFGEQITQFGQLEQLFNLNDNVEKLAANSGGDDKLQAVQLIGKTAVVEGNQLQISENGSSQIGVHLPGSTQSLKVHVLNEAGSVVRTLEYQDLPSGNQFIDFDGKSQDGSQLSPGKYYFSAEAVGQDSVPIAVPTLMSGKISDVEFYSDGVLIKSGDMAFNFSDIISVRE